MLYHGSPRRFETFKTPTGRSVMDVTVGGVVYLTADRSVASKYAGPGGYIYTVAAPDAVPYAEQRAAQGLAKKSGKYTRGVWVCLPEGCSIVAVERS